MAKTVSIMMVGDKEVIGALDTSFLAPGSKIYPGTLAVNGPVYMGLVPNQGIPQATVMIGPPIGIPASPPYSLQVDGISNSFVKSTKNEIDDFDGPIADDNTIQAPLIGTCLYAPNFRRAKQYPKRRRTPEQSSLDCDIYSVFTMSLE